MSSSPAPAASGPAARPACKQLVLDAGPLLSLAPLRGLAEAYYTVPQVLDELKDKRAREHFEKLGLSAGVRIQVQGPGSAALAHVIQWSKKTGDYSVLSHADLCVLALTYELDEKEKKAAAEAASSFAEKSPEAIAGETEASQSDIATPEGDDPQEEEAPKGNAEELSAEEETPSEEGGTQSEPTDDPSDAPDRSEIEESGEEEVDPGVQNSSEEEADHPDDGQDSPEEEQSREPLDVVLQPLKDDTPALSSSPPPPATELSNTSPSTSNPPPPIYDDPSDSDDGEGEWITPSNVALHKSRALDLLPAAGGNKRKGGKQEPVVVGCMTADFAMQNVLLQMGLALVGVEGKRIDRVKSWVLRCHACFKICKDGSRKFCPSCGNPTLLRASVTISSPNAGPNTPALQVHLKKNFQYRTRGTIYSIPAPKAGSAKTGPGEGLILREDQTAWVRAKKVADGKREREEKRILNAASKSAEKGEAGTVVSSWMDPDWVPEILSTGTGGKGRSMRSRGMDGDMPVIGHGKKNPNERKRRK